MWETWVQSLGWEDPLEEGMAIHSSILAWRIPRTEEPGGLQSMGSIAESDTTEQLTQHKLFSHIFKRYSKYWEHSRERERIQVLGYIL